MKDAHGRQTLLLSLGFVVVCAAVAAIAFRDQLLATVARMTDRSPPHATFSFRTANGGMSHESLVVEPGEVFVPFLGIRDDVDSSPTATVWLTPVGATSEQPVTIGSPLALDEPGLWHLHARVMDASGNSTTRSTVISVCNDPEQVVPTASDRPEPIGGQSDHSDDMAFARSGGARVARGIEETTSVGVAVAIEDLQLIEDEEGVRSIDATIMIGSTHGLAELDRSHVSLFPLDDAQRPIPQVGWDLIPETQGEYLPDGNLWRMQFRWEYEQPLPRKPASLRISFVVGAGDQRHHFFADSDGLRIAPDPTEAIRARLSSEHR